MTSLTMRMIKGEFVVIGPDVERNPPPEAALRH
jgi:hypothetical protein